MRGVPATGMICVCIIDKNMFTHGESSGASRGLAIDQDVAGAVEYAVLRFVEKVSGPGTFPIEQGPRYVRNVKSTATGNGTDNIIE